MIASINFHKPGEDWSDLWELVVIGVVLGSVPGLAVAFVTLIFGEG